jgi:hypothetical protein
VAKRNSRDSDASSALRRQLGSDLDVLDQLTEPESTELLGLIDDVRAAQKVALDAALGEVLGKLPRLVRLPARKIMFG